MVFKSIFALTLLMVSAPAAAQAGTSVPEPSDMLLLGMGVLGLILGRRGGRSRKPPKR